MTDDSGRSPGVDADDGAGRTDEGTSVEVDHGEESDHSDVSNRAEPSDRSGESADEVDTPAENSSGAVDESVEESETAEEGDPEAAVDDPEAAEADPEAGDTDREAEESVPPDVRKYERFTKVDDAEYERVNEFLRERTYITAREWAIARLCADFRTETGVEMTKIGENLPELVPFMTDTYSPQAVNQARASFEEKVRTAGATFLYGAMSDFFTPGELDEVMYEVTEIAKFLLEVEGVDLAVEEELEAEDRISGVMREVREASEALRYETCPNCGHDLRE